MYEGSILEHKAKADRPDKLLRSSAIATPAQWAIKCRDDLKRLTKINEKEGQNFTNILDRFQRDSLDQMNKVIWGQTEEFKNVSNMIWRHLGANEPFLPDLGGSFTEVTAEAMDLAAQRGKEDVRLDIHGRTAMRQRQDARGTGQALKVTTLDGQSLPAHRHPQFLPVQRAARAAEAESTADYAQGPLSWSNYRPISEPSRAPSSYSSSGAKPSRSNKIQDTNMDEMD